MTCNKLINHSNETAKVFGSSAKIPAYLQYIQDMLENPEPDEQNMLFDRLRDIYYTCKDGKIDLSVGDEISKKYTELFDFSKFVIDGVMNEHSELIVDGRWTGIGINSLTELSQMKISDDSVIGFLSRQSIFAPEDIWEEEIIPTIQKVYKDAEVIPSKLSVLTNSCNRERSVPQGFFDEIAVIKADLENFRKTEFRIKNSSDVNMKLIDLETIRRFPNLFDKLKQLRQQKTIDMRRTSLQDVHDRIDVLSEHLESIESKQLLYKEITKQEKRKMLNKAQAQDDATLLNLINQKDDSFMWKNGNKLELAMDLSMIMFKKTLGKTTEEEKKQVWIKLNKLF